MAMESDVLISLRERVRAIETASRPARRLTSLGCPALDALAPEGGVAAGTIHEWLAPGPGWGAELLSLVAAREVCRSGGALVILDAEEHFYPPAAADWGIDLGQVILLRGCQSAELAWAIDQALRTAAVAAVWGRVGALDERWLRRFQLSAEHSGAVGLFVRPATARRQPSWCETRWFCLGKSDGGKRAAPARRIHLERVAEAAAPRRIQLELIRARGGLAGQIIDVQIDSERGTIISELRHAQKISLPLARQLAHPAARRTAARA